MYERRRFEDSYELVKFMNNKDIDFDEILYIGLEHVPPYRPQDYWYIIIYKECE